MGYVIWILAGLILLFCFNSDAPKKSKPKITPEPKVKPQPEETPKPKRGWLNSLFNTNGENVRAYSDYVSSHSSSVKVFYFIARYSMTKDGYKGLVSSYIVKPDNYYGYVRLRDFSAVLCNVEGEIAKSARQLYPNKEIIISKLR